MLVDKRFLFRMKMAQVIAKSDNRKERLANLPAVERTIVGALVIALDRGLKPRV